MTGVEPVTTLTTPGGKPTSCMIRTSSITASGFCDAGRTTTVLPIASAGPSLPAMLTTGKLYGVIAATAPTGWRRAIAPISPPGASAVAGHLHRRERDHVRLVRHARVRLEAHAGLRHLHLLADRRGATGLRDDQRQEVVELVAHRVGDLLQQVGAHVGRRLRPGRERLLGGAGRVERLLLRRLGRDADDFFGRGIDDLVAAVGAVDPLPADQELRCCHGAEL